MLVLVLNDCSADWTKPINRGVLMLVNGNTYQFLVAVEARLWQFLRVTSVERISDGIKSALVETISGNEFFWTILAAKWEGVEEKVLLSMVIELWITICGLSFARSLFEMYKQSNKKTIRKSKGLRKKLAQ